MIFVHLNDEHVFLVFFPVAGLDPKLAIDDLGCVDLNVSARALFAAHEILQVGIDAPAVGVPEYLARGLFLHVEQVHLAPKAAVIPFFGFLKKRHVLLEVIAVAERHAVDALQHGTGIVAQEIRSRHIGQLKGIGRHLAGMLQVRAAAQVHPFAMPVHANVFAFGDAI